MSTVDLQTGDVVEIHVGAGHRQIQIILVAEHLGLAGRGQDDELVAHVAADRPAFRAHRDRLQAEPRKGAQIRHEHLVVGMPRAGLIDVERIGVLHQEFAAAHQPEARPHLVPELPLDVIEIERQVLVGPHVGPEDIGDHFLVGRAVQHVALVAVLDAQHFLAVGLVAAALAPEVGRLDGRHQQSRWRRRGSAPRARSARSSSAPGARAAERHKFRPPPGASCRRAASADGRRFRPPSGSRAGSAGRNGTGASASRELDGWARVPQ